MALLSKGLVFDPKKYEYKEDFVPWDGVDPLGIHTTQELIEAIKKYPDKISVDARLIGTNSNGKTMVKCTEKDLLGFSKRKGNKKYSAETCCFIPTVINSLLITTGKNRGELPIGVRLAKGGVRYRSDIGKNGKNYYLGTYDTIDEAFNSYKEAREDFYKEKAEEWKHALSKDAYIALRNRVVDITD